MSRFKLKVLGFLAFIVMLSLGFALLGTSAAQNPVIDWDQIAITAALNANQTLSPGSNLAGTASIYLAYAHLAIFNAVNAIDHRFQSYGPDIAAPAGASPEAAAIAAAYYTLLNYLPDQSAYLATQYAASLAAIPDGSAKTDGIQVGHDAANAIISLRSSDGRGANVPYSYPSLPTAGVWIPTPPGFLKPQAPWAGQMTPFTNRPVLDREYVQAVRAGFPRSGDCAGPESFGYGAVVCHFVDFVRRFHYRLLQRQISFQFLATGYRHSERRHRRESRYRGGSHLDAARRHAQSSRISGRSRMCHRLCSQCPKEIFRHAERDAGCQQHGHEHNTHFHKRP